MSTILVDVATVYSMDESVQGLATSVGWKYTREAVEIFSEKLRVWCEHIRCGNAHLQGLTKVELLPSALKETETKDDEYYKTKSEIPEGQLTMSKDGRAVWNGRELPELGEGKNKIAWKINDSWVVKTNKRKTKVEDSEKEREWAQRGLLPQTELKYDEHGDMVQLQRRADLILKDFRAKKGTTEVIMEWTRAITNIKIEK